MIKVLIVLALVVAAAIIGSPHLRNRIVHRAPQTSVPSPTPSPSPSPTATPWPSPVEVKVYLWFNYKYQKANQSEYLFYASFNAGQAEKNTMLVKCKLNQEYVQGLITKEAQIEIEAPYSKCRRLDP